MRVISGTPILPAASTPPSAPPSPEKEKAAQKPEGEYEQVFNIRGGKLVLTFCSMGGLVNVQIVRGGDYGLTNAELGRGMEEELHELGQALVTLAAAVKANKQVDAVVGHLGSEE
jgi:hypothetical protein